MSVVLEWWPEADGSLLWSTAGRGGDRVELESLPLAPALVARVRAWVGEYDEDNLPIEGPGDRAWLEAGTELLRETRVALGEDYRIIVTEPWWGEPAVDE